MLERFLSTGELVGLGCGCLGERDLLPRLGPMNRGGFGSATSCGGKVSPSLASFLVPPELSVGTIVGIYEGSSLKGNLYSLLGLRGSGAGGGEAFFPLGPSVGL